MLNTTIIQGRLTRDPELRYTQSNVAVVSFSLAVERNVKSNSGTREADFIDVTAWRQTAEFASKYFSKGSMAIVQGRLQQRRWQDKDGNNRSSFEVVADSIYFGGAKTSDGSETRSRNTDAPTTAERVDYSTGELYDIPEEDGELPF